jgi:hypothetical protein
MRSKAWTASRIVQTDHESRTAAAFPRRGRPRARRPLVGVVVLHVLDVPEGPPHILEDLHVVERRFERGGGGLDSLHGRTTGGLGGGAGLLTNGPGSLREFSKALSLLADRLKCFPMLIAELPRFLGESPELFGLFPRRLGRQAVFFGRHAILLGVLTAVFSLLAHTLCPLALLIWWALIVRHVGFLLQSHILKASADPGKFVVVAWVRRHVVPRPVYAHSDARTFAR